MQPAIQSLADLKGKQVGVETRGDTHELAMRQAFTAAGVDPASVVFTPLSNRSAIVASLMTGGLAASSMVTDEVERLRSVANARLLFDLQKINLIAGGGVFAERMLKENRPLAKRFMRAVVKGHRRGLAEPDDIVASVRKRNASLSAEEIKAAIQVQRPLNTKDGTISLELQAQEIANRSAVLNIPPEKRRRPEEMFDFSLLQEVNAELDAQGWKP
jgi:ABC-type nitrate/sulfonate/bicarbonate transport system substrate-binding protein